MIPTQQCSQHPGSTGAIATRGSPPAPVPPQGAPAHPVPSPGRREQVRVPPHPGPPRPVTRHPCGARAAVQRAEHKQKERLLATGREESRGARAPAIAQQQAALCLAARTRSLQIASQPAAAPQVQHFFIRNHQNSE